MEYLISLVEKFFETVYNIPELIRLGGLAGLILIVFAETGLLVGFFLPGDSLLITAGLFAARGDLDIVWLNVALILAAIIGDATGYWIGRMSGPRLFRKEESMFLKPKYMRQAHDF